MSQITVEVKKEGWYGVGERFLNHYFLKSKTETKSRCGKIFRVELDADSIKNQCSSCQNLLQHDNFKEQMVEPHRY